ncbi:MAG: hypothetical protein ACRC5G_08040 [Cetobacterium sp.]
MELIDINSNCNDCCEETIRLQACANGIPYIILLDKNTNAVTYLNLSTNTISNTSPVNLQVGSCSVVSNALITKTIKTGSLSIADGTFATSLGFNGTSYTPAIILKSITISARKSNTSDSNPATIGNKVVITTTDGDTVLLTGESVTFSAEDNNILNFISVTCKENSAALVIYNYE